MDYKHTRIFLILLFSIVFSACKNNYSDVDCMNYDYSDCTTIEPQQAVIEINVTINNENPAVPISIFKGFIEDSNLVYCDTLHTTEFTISLPVNEYYSAKANYTKNGQQVIAVDADKIEKTGTDVCDSTCWSVNKGKMNLELK